ncbi:hypothetical protein HNR19_004036 [Nocardioides thalensis]|uniref:Uncharacterized protein n=2 Tax=Nocardioides thalensis TaxID=1914755 RepID=A0A853CA79_9ACTN|nr:hypothetical protein [Nocardioides thalensis]
MPPSGGPLIGSGMKASIAEAAIVADMEHRGFTHHGDGVFKELGASGGEYDGVYWNVVVKDGSVAIEMVMGQRSDIVPDESEYAHLQAEVFDYWPRAIDDAFSNWEDMAESDPLRWDLSSVLRGAEEIRVTATNDAGSGKSNGANVRLDADITNLSTRTAELNGLYAEAFNENYVSRLRPVLDNLHSMTMVLAFGVAGEQELFQRTREQIAQVALDAEKAMKASGPRSGGVDITGITIGLIVVGAVCGGIAAVASGGAAIAAATVVATSLGNVGAGAVKDLLGALVKPPAPPQPIPLGAGHPKEVLTNIVNGLAEINTRIRAEEQQLVDLFEAAHGDLSLAAAAGPFNIARPEIIDHGGTSVLESAQTVLVDPTAIAKITELWIPTIIGDINACRSELDGQAYSWTRPAGIGLSETGPWSSYSALQSGVASLLAETATELEGAAGSLQAAAADIGLSDETANETYAAQARRITEDNINY